MLSSRHTIGSAHQIGYPSHREVKVRLRTQCLTSFYVCIPSRTALQQNSLSHRPGPPVTSWVVTDGSTCTLPPLFTSLNSRRPRVTSHTNTNTNNWNKFSWAEVLHRPQTESSFTLPSSLYVPANATCSFQNAVVVQLLGCSLRFPPHIRISAHKFVYKSPSMLMLLHPPLCRRLNLVHTFRNY